MDVPPTEDLSWINAAGDCFEEAWARGDRPRIEEFLDGAAGTRREALLRHLLGVEIELCRQRGERPGLEDYEARFPADRELVRELFEEEPIPDGTTIPDPFPGEFRVLRYLGGGGFGEVWLAEDLNLPRLVALKTLKRRNGPRAHDATLEALRNDAAALIRVRHPNVVQVYAWRQSGAEHYLVLQYVAGGSLAELLKREGPLDWRRAVRYIADVGEGLLSVHARGIVHRDLKPANILWDKESDEALLTDFSIAAHLAAKGSVAGTLAYMAPEAFAGSVSPALDVYGLAASLYQLVAGTVPFDGPDLSDLLEKIALGLPMPDPKLRGLPEPLEQLLRAGLAACPKHRPDLRVFISELRGVLNRLIADDLMPRPAVAGGPSPVDLRLVVRRRMSPGVYEPVAATPPVASPGSDRDPSLVPPSPPKVRLQTGDRLAITIVADREGYLTAFNVGPTGNLNLLHPEDLSAPARLIAAGAPLTIADVELTPPEGNERLVAVWSLRPLPLSREHLLSLAEGSDARPSRPYLATRDIKLVKESVQRLEPGERHVIVLELDHGRGD